MKKRNFNKIIKVKKSKEEKLNKKIMSVCKFYKKILDKLKQETGSLTVEATISLIVYIMALVSVINLLLGIDASAHINGAMYKGAYEFSVNDRDRYVEGKKEYLEEERIKQLIDAEYINKKPIISGLEGIKFAFSIIGEYMQDINIKSRYYINIPGIDVINNGYLMEQNIKCRLFTGDMENKSNKKFVYVTNSGKVYHTDVECTYLIIKKQSVLLKDIEDYRNNSGSKYEMCKECKYEDCNSKYVYITNYGTSYHKIVTCSTITRTIRAIEISEINKRKACEKCIGESFLMMNKENLH